MIRYILTLSICLLMPSATLASEKEIVDKSTQAQIEKQVIGFDKKSMYFSFGTKDIPLVGFASKVKEAYDSHLPQEKEKQTKHPHRNALIKGTIDSCIRDAEDLILLACVPTPIKPLFPAANALVRNIDTKPIIQQMQQSPCLHSATSDNLWERYLAQTCKRDHQEKQLLLDTKKAYENVRNEFKQWAYDVAIAGADKYNIKDNNIHEVRNFVYGTYTSLKKEFSENIALTKHFIQQLPQKTVQGVKDSKSALHHFTLLLKNKMISVEDTLQDKLAQYAKSPVTVQNNVSSVRNTKEYDNILAQEIKQQNQQFLADLKKMTDSFKQELVQPKTITTTTAITLQQECKIAAEREDFIHRSYYALQGIADLAYIAGCDKATINKCYAFGAASIKLADSINTLAATGFSLSSCASLSGCIEPYTGIISFVATCVALCQDDGLEDGFEAVLDAINHAMMQISQQIAQFHEDVMKRFDGLEEMIEAHHRIMLREFALVNLHSQDIKVWLKKLDATIRQAEKNIAGRIDSLHDNMVAYHNLLNDNVIALHIRPLNECIQNVLVEVEKNERNNEKLAKRKNKLAYELLHGSVQAPVTGGNISIDNCEQIRNALEASFLGEPNVYCHPAFANINLLAHYISKKQGNSIAPLANPILWLRGAQAFIEVIEKQLSTLETNYTSESEQDNDIKNLEKLKDQGESLLTFIASAGNAAMIQQLGTEYTACLEKLDTLIKYSITAYEQKRSKELAEQHTIVIDKEIIHLNSLPTPQFPDYGKDIDSVMSANFDYRRIRMWQIMKQNKSFIESIPSGMRQYWNITFRGSAHQPEFQEILACKVVSAHNRKNKFDHLYKSKDGYQNQLHQKKEELKKPKLALFNAVDNQITSISSISKLVYPRNNSGALLSLPKEALPIDKIYLVAEQLGLGTIRYEYWTDGYFHLYAYFVTENNKQLILHMRKDSFYYLTKVQEPDNVKLYHYWEGGRYAKNDDKFLCKMDYSAQGGLVTQYTIMYPPIIPYKPERDTFVSTAQVMPVADAQQHKQAMVVEVTRALALERTHYYSQLLQQTSASNNSELFTLLQKLDVHYKVLDSVFALCYSELYRKHQTFSCMHQDTITHLKNYQGIKKYLQHNAKNLDVHGHSESMLKHLTTTKSTFTQMITLLNQSKTQLKPSFPAISNVIAKLTQAINIAKSRIVTTISKTPSSYLPQEIQDHLVKQEKTISVLTQKVEDLTAIIQKQQIQHEQMTLLLSQFLTLAKK